MKLPIRLLQLLICLGCGPLWAQSQDACLQKLQELYRHEQAYQKTLLESGSGWQMKYTLETFVYNARDHQYHPVVTDGELVATAKVRYMKTPLMEAYMDDKDAFTIDGDRKIVTRTESGGNFLAAQSNPYLDLLSDSSMQHYRITGCQEVKDMGKLLRRYDIVSIDKAKTPYLKMSLYVDETERMFCKIYSEINPRYSKQVSAHTLIIKERGEHKASVNWYPVQKMVLRANGQLQSQYRDYRYKDIVKKYSRSQSVK